MYRHLKQYYFSSCFRINDERHRTTFALQGSLEEKFESNSILNAPLLEMQGMVESTHTNAILA